MASFSFIFFGAITLITSFFFIQVPLVWNSEPKLEEYGLFIFGDNSCIEKCNIDLIAVHGLGGHWHETWVDGRSKKLWLWDFLPSQLPTARIMLYGYNARTAFSKAVTGIEDEALMLLDRLEGERRLQGESTRPIIFLSHSLGGIIVKKALILAHERSSVYGDLLSSVRGLVFFGVPHRGADTAYWAAFAAHLLKVIQLGFGTNVEFVNALKKNSKSFADISQQFVERATHLKIRTFYETEKLYNQLIVDRASARLGLPNEIAVGIAGADHLTICKFNSVHSQKYNQVWNAIKGLVDAALLGSIPCTSDQKALPVSLIPPIELGIPSKDNSLPPAYARTMETAVPSSQNPGSIRQTNAIDSESVEVAAYKDIQTLNQDKVDDNMQETLHQNGYQVASTQVIKTITRAILKGQLKLEDPRGDSASMPKTPIENADELLAVAIKGRDVIIARLLRNQQSSLRYEERRVLNLLNIAVTKKDEKMVRLLLENRINIKYETEHFISMLTGVVTTGNRIIAELLIEGRRLFKYETEFFVSMLESAVEKEDEEMVRALLQ